MRILISKVWEGAHRYTVIPRSTAHMAPVQVSGSEEAKVVEELRVILVAVTDRERPPTLEVTQ